MQAYDWPVRFKLLYEKALQQYREGHRDSETLFDAGERRFLESIGARPIEVYDYVEDAAGIDWGTALLITAVRRDYFLVVQGGVASSRRLSMTDFPAKDAELDGIPWLPRLILKAKLRLRGEMPQDMMYCCGGDRRFLQQYNIHPADFLRFTWSVDGDEAKTLENVRGQS